MNRKQYIKFYKSLSELDKEFGDTPSTLSVFGRGILAIITIKNKILPEMWKMQMEIDSLKEQIQKLKKDGK